MPADLHAAAYLADGADLASATAKLTHDGAGLWAGLSEDIGISVSPGIDGGNIGGGLWKPYTLSTMYLVRASGFDAVWAEIVALRRRCKPGRTVELTRRMPDPDGSDANTDQVTIARRQADRIDWLGADAAALDIDWLIADGPWYGSSVAIASAAGTNTVDGDVPTHRLLVTLPAGVARTVTNTTTGHWFTFTTGTPTGGTLIDVEARTATNIISGADVSQYLVWGKTHPLLLAPGANVLTVSAATASIDYQPAYL